MGQLIWIYIVTPIPRTYSNRLTGRCGVVSSIVFFRIQNNALSAEVTPGHYYDTATEQVFECPINTYQNESSQTSCNECPDGKITMTPGATRIEDCYGRGSIGIERYRLQTTARLVRSMIIPIQMPVVCLVPSDLIHRDTVVCTAHTARMEWLRTLELDYLYFFHLISLRIQRMLLIATGSANLARRWMAIQISASHARKGSTKTATKRDNARNVLMEQRRRLQGIHPVCDFSKLLSVSEPSTKRVAPFLIVRSTCMQTPQLTLIRSISTSPVIVLCARWERRGYLTLIIRQLNYIW